MIERNKLTSLQTDNALTEAHNSYKTASHMLETFENFQNIYKANVDKAKEAKTLIASIEDNLNECDNEIHNLKDLLAVSQSTVEHAAKSIQHYDVLVHKELPVWNKNLIYFVILKIEWKYLFLIQGIP